MFSILFVFWDTPAEEILIGLKNCVEFIEILLNASTTEGSKDEFSPVLKLGVDEKNFDTSSCILPENCCLV